MLGLYESMVQFRQRFDFPKGSEQAKRFHIMITISEDEADIIVTSEEPSKLHQTTDPPLRELTCISDCFIKVNHEYGVMVTLTLKLCNGPSFGVTPSVG